MEEKQNKEQELDTVYRWYELDRYDENVPEGQKGKIQSNLEETFSVLLDSLRMMGEKLNIRGSNQLSLKRALEVCEKKQNSLSEYVEEIFKAYIKQHSQEMIARISEEVINENRDKIEKEIREKIVKSGESKSEEEIQSEIDKALEEKVSKEAKKRVYSNMAKIAENSISQNALPQVKAYVQCYLDSFAEYGPGARDNVVTAMVISGGVQHKGEENEPYSSNALYGCGFGKTTVSKGVAMGKMSIGKRAVITSSTPELAGQSFDELKDGFAQREMSVLYYSEGEVKFLDKSGEVKGGKDKPLTENEIAKYFKDADVIVSDLTALIKAKEAGLYEPNRDRDSLLQDEQDSDMFHNLWSVEIKGKEYTDKEHASRILARKEADKIVRKFIEKKPDSVKGNKVKQSVSIDGRSPRIEIVGKKVIFEGEDGYSITVPDDLEELEEFKELGIKIEPIEFAEFIMDSLLARELYTDKGKDYVVKDGKIEAISPSTGGRNDIPEGVIQALAIKEGVEEIQPEKRVEKVVSKMTFLKESFAEISGMSATYGMDPEQFLKTVSDVGTSQDLIEVKPLIKKGRIPNFENLGEDEKKPTICKKDAEKETDLQVTMSDGTIKTCPSAHIAAIVRDIEAHKDEAIIIGTDNREKTIEIVEALSKIYPDRVVEGYSSVPDEKGDPKLLPPPNPATGEKLGIGVGKIVVGDHCIGRGVTPKKPDKDKGTGEHLIMAQMPSRSEGLLEQFLGRVGRKDDDGSVSFVLQEDDLILEEFRQLNNGKEPEDILEVIGKVYPEKTKDAIEATKGDIKLGRIAIARNKLIDIILRANGLKSLEEFNNLAEDKKAHVIQEIEGALKYFDKSMAFKSKQLKGKEDIQLNISKIGEEYLSIESLMERENQERFAESKDKSAEIEGLSLDSRYSQIKAIYEKAKELSELLRDTRTNGDITHNDDAEGRG